MKITVYKIRVFKKKGPLGFLLSLLRLNSSDYWIEYRVDEDRYWYFERKGFKTKGHHSKKGIHDAVDIVKNIAYRASIFLELEHKVLVDNIEVIADKDEFVNMQLLGRSKKAISGLFLSD